MHYSRKERRELAKKMGLLGKTSNKKWIERVRRGINAGNQIHAQFVNDVENRLIKERSEKEASNYKSDSDGEDKKD